MRPVLPVPGVSIEQVSVSSVRLAWSAPEVSGVMYRFVAQQSDGGGEPVEIEVLAADESADLSGLEVSTAYTLQVTAQVDGYESNTETLTFATQLASPSLAVEDAEAEDGSRTTQSAVVVWTTVVKECRHLSLELV